MVSGCTCASEGEETANPLTAEVKHRKGESQRTFGLLPLAGRPLDVVGFGENSVDVLATVPRWPQPDEKIELLSLSTLPGGQAASAMVACARLGCRARYLGVFGDDSHGQSAQRALELEGVDTRGCLIARAPNRSALIIVEPASGTRTVLWQRDAGLRWPSTSTFPEVMAQTRALLVDATDLDASVAAASASREAGVPVVVDVDQTEPGLDRLLRQVDVLVAAKGFPASHTGEPSLGKAMRLLHAEYRPKAVVVTLGDKGAVAWDGEREVESPGFLIPVVDPTGAGDAFRGGFLAAWLDRGREQPATLLDLLTFANATAALNCRAVGAQAGLPTRAEVLALLTDPGVRRSNRAGPVWGAGHS